MLGVEGAAGVLGVEGAAGVLGVEGAAGAAGACGVVSVLAFAAEPLSAFELSVFVSEALLSVAEPFFAVESSAAWARSDALAPALAAVCCAAAACASASSWTAALTSSERDAT